MQRHSIRTKIISLTLALILVSIVSFGAIGIYFIMEESNRLSARTLNLICENRKDAMNDYLDSVRQSVDVIAQYAGATIDVAALADGGVLGADGSTVTEMPGRSEAQRKTLDAYFDGQLVAVEDAFHSVANHTKGITAYYFRINPQITQDAKGFLYAKNKEGNFEKIELTDIGAFDPDDISHVGWYYVPLQKGEPSWVGPYRNENMDRLMFSYVVPLYKDDTFIGVIGMDIAYDTLETLIKKFDAFDTGFFALMDEEGRILCHPEYEMGTDLKEVLPTIETVIEEMQQNPSSNDLIRYDKDGAVWQMTYTTLTGGMILAAVVQEAEINTIGHRLADIFLFVGVVILVVAAVVMVLSTKYITDPLKKLTESAGRLAAGDYDVSLDYEGKDEVGVLTSTFRFMSSRLKEHFDDLNTQLEERKKLQDVLSGALLEAEEANKAKTAFLSNMSHEIRTPMNAIIGLDRLALEDESINEQTRSYLEKIGESANHLLDLINDILDMSRIESGRVVLHRVEFSLSVMLEQINTMVMAQCSDKGLSYECHILSKVDDCYIGDDMKLKEILINILSNAIKFTDAPGSVTLSVERTARIEEQSTLRFCVKDTGIGMEKEYLPKIFESFSQEDASRKNKYGSTGLGMAITKRIVEMMNGEITVTSEKGVGTEFVVTITLRNCAPKDVSSNNLIDPHAMYVLVVDGDEVAAEHARMVLDEVGIRTDVSVGVPDALGMIEVAQTKQEPYNLILLDWKMPESDGLEVIGRIRKLCGREMTAIFLTAYNKDEVEKEAHRAGADGFLAKPIFASNVMEEFELLLRRKEEGVSKEEKLANLDGRQILLAEDVKINAEIMKKILSKKGIRTDHATNGRLAVEMFANSEVGTYAAILMDVRMPEMDGLEAAAAIRAMDRKDAKQIPIIALTANAFDEDVQRSLQAGMNAHLSKPVEAELLFEAMGRLVYEAENEI